MEKWERKHRVLTDPETPLSRLLCDNCCVNATKKLMELTGHWGSFPEASPKHREQAPLTKSYTALLKVPSPTQASRLG